MSHKGIDPKIEFRRKIEPLTESQLRSRFPDELTCYKGLIDRVGGTSNLHPGLSDFKKFLTVLGAPRPNSQWTVDRIDPHDPEYAPGKIRWADKRQQSNNRRNTIMLADANGEIRSISDWAKLTRQKPNTMRQRFKRGWTHEEIIKGHRVRGGAAQNLGQKTENSATSDLWPAKVDHNLWEREYRKFLEKQKMKISELHRYTFFCWIIKNILRRSSAVVDRNSLGSVSRAVSSRDPLVHNKGNDKSDHEKLTAIFHEAHSEVVHHREQAAMFGVLVRTWPNVYNAREAAKLSAVNSRIFRSLVEMTLR